MSAFQDWIHSSVDKTRENLVNKGYLTAAKNMPVDLKPWIVHACKIGWNAGVDAATENDFATREKLREPIP